MKQRTVEAVESSSIEVGVSKQDGITIKADGAAAIITAAVLGAALIYYFKSGKGMRHLRKAKDVFKKISFKKK